jgi:hypothetical protein
MKNPHLEIERKFLIDTLPRGLHRYPHKEIAQGYLAVRSGQGTRALAACWTGLLAHFKRGPARQREEREIHLRPEQFAILGRPRPELA